jgi:hypothetical protein
MMSSLKRSVLRTRGGFGHSEEIVGKALADIFEREIENDVLPRNQFFWAARRCVAFQTRLRR